MFNPFEQLSLSAVDVQPTEVVVLPFLKALGMSGGWPAEAGLLAQGGMTAAAKCLRRRDLCHPGHRSNGSASDRIMIHRNRETADRAGTDPPRARPRFPGLTARPRSRLTNPCDHRAPGVSFPRPMSRATCELVKHLGRRLPDRSISALGAPVAAQPPPRRRRHLPGGAGGARPTERPPSCGAFLSLTRQPPPASAPTC